MAKVVTYDQVPLCPSISLARALRNLQQHNSLCDLTLISEDHKKVYVHKAVFAAMSGYIQKRLKNKQPCDSFILTGISVEGIKSLTEFVYGNVYAIHCNNAEEIYPVAKLFEFTLLCKVAEYIDPQVSKTDYNNKIIPVSPNLLSKKPNKTPQPRKRAEENDNATPNTSEDQSSPEEDDEASQPAKRKKLDTKNQTPKIQLAKRTKKDEEVEENKSDKEKENPKTKKGGEADKKEEKKSPTKKTKGDDGDQDGKPIITQQLKIKLERIDIGQKRDASLSSSKSTSEKKRSDEAKVNHDSPVKSTPEKKRSDKAKGSHDSPVKEENVRSDVTMNGFETSPSKEKETTPKPSDETLPKEKDVVTKGKEENSPSKEREATTKRKEETPSTEEKKATPSAGKHKKSKPPDETVFECGRCKVIFTSLEKCNEHMAKAHKVTMVSVNENFICSKEDCGFKCSDAETLKTHVLVEHPQALVKKHTCGICDAELDSVEALESHVSTEHSKKRVDKGKDRKSLNINGKDNNDEPELDLSTGELQVTNRPGPKSAVTNRPGPKSSKLKQQKLVPDSPKRTETKVVNGQKIKVTYLDDRLVRVEDDSLLDGWSKLLVARRDFSKYDMYIQSPDNKRHRSMKELLEYLDSKQIEMETDHISFKTSQLLEEAGIPPLKSSAGTPRRLNKPGPKSSKKFKEKEESDEEMEVDADSDNDGERKVNGNISDDDKKAASKEKSSKQDVDGEDVEMVESDSESHVHQVEVHVA